MLEHLAGARVIEARPHRRPRLGLQLREDERERVARAPRRRAEHEVGIDAGFAMAWPISGASATPRVRAAGPDLASVGLLPARFRVTQKARG